RDGDQSDAQLVLPFLRQGNRDTNNFLCKSDDADASAMGSNTLVPYVFDSETCPESYVKGVELARFEGSGPMTHLWLTSDLISSGTGRFADEVLRVYVDDNPRVLIQIPLQQVLNGMGGEIFTIPFGAQSPSTIAWRYPISFSSKLILAIDHIHA